MQRELGVAFLFDGVTAGLFEGLFDEPRDCGLVIDEKNFL